MALPRLNEFPQYELIIPSTGETINYRPFLVKEQKVLILALESQDQKQVLNAILNCIDACCEGVDSKNLATFDVEYIFTQIRGKSVGESTKINVACGKCEENNEVKIDLNKIALQENIDIKNKFVKLTDDITVELKYPTYSEFMKKSNLETNLSANIVFQLMSACLEAVILNDEERVSIKDESADEVENFINSLTSEQFAKMQAFVEEIPKIHMDITFQCGSCEENNVRRLEGLTDFFS